MRTSLKVAVVLGAAAVGAVIAGGALVATGAASRADALPPRSIVPPTVTGLQVGQTQTAGVGTWTGTGPITYTYQWVRSDGGDGTPIVGATAPTYTPTDADIGHSVFVQVKGQNAAGPGWANSYWTSQVAGATSSATVALPDGRTSVSADNVALPNHLIVSAAAFAPAKISASGSVVAKVTVLDTLQHPVHGALVQIVAIPFGSLGVLAEATTDDSGVATFTLKGTSQLARTPGGVLGLSIRARKTGDDVLAGVTATRLFGLPVTH
jgi:hypothetical protein